MAFYGGYGYPMPLMYDPWRTTYVPQHYPVKHPHLDHMRHEVSESLGSIATSILHPFGPEDPVLNPRADVRESSTHYYVDVELPGMETKDNLKIKWLNTRTFIIEARLERPGILEEPKMEAEITGRELKDDKEAKEKDKKDGPTLTIRERHVGLFGRAFSFPTDVIHEKLQATLNAGLLRIVVPKQEVEGAKKELKDIEVKHNGT